MTPPNPSRRCPRPCESNPGSYGRSAASSVTPRVPFAPGARRLDTGRLRIGERVGERGYNRGTGVLPSRSPGFAPGFVEVPTMNLDDDNTTGEYIAYEDFVSRFFLPSLPPVRVEFGAMSHRGLVRPNNEDHFLISRLR